MEDIKKFLDKRREEGLLRILRPHGARRGGRIFLKGREYFDLSSNDYLGLSDHPQLIEAGQKAYAEFGAGSGGSRLLSGDSELHHELESRVALFKGKEASLIFNSGYQANIGILSAIAGPADAVFCDRLAHASLIDGMILSQARFFRFRHNDVEHLRELLQKERGRFKKAIIVTESVFSMDGDRAPLKDIVGLKKEFNCLMMVDEAHATGIFGSRGSGVAEEDGVAEDVDLLMGTFGKALGSFGAYVAASKLMVDYLVNTARSFIYSTALPLPVIAVNLASLDLVRHDPGRRLQLLELAKFLRQGLKDKGFQVKGDSQIVPVVLGSAFQTQRIAQNLQEKGFWMLAVRPPTVPEGQSRLRLSLTTYHTEEILKKLIDDISSAAV